MRRPDFFYGDEKEVQNTFRPEPVQTFLTPKKNTHVHLPPSQQKVSTEFQKQQFLTDKKKPVYMTQQKTNIYDHARESLFSSPTQTLDGKNPGLKIISRQVMDAVAKN
jgi:hypothetical protein